MKNSELTEIGKSSKKEKLRERPDNAKRNEIAVDPANLHKYIDSAIIMRKQPRCDMTDPGEVGRRIEFYFDLCNNLEIKPNQIGLALALGLERITLLDYLAGRLGRNAEVQKILKNANSILEYLMSCYMTDGKVNPIPAIFLLKNFHGYRDQAEVVLRPANPLGEVQDRAELEAKYAESVIIDVTPAE